MRFIAFDLETTGVDVETAEVAQAAGVEARLRAPIHTRATLEIGETSTQLFKVASIPESATAVHGIRTEDVVNMPTFASCVASFVKQLLAPDVVLVSFNGCAYDIPIIARYANLAGGVKLDLAQQELLSRDWIESHLRRRHIDVMRLWWRIKNGGGRAPWTKPGHAASHLTLTADMFAGSLAAAHGFFTGRGFDDAHDAGVDCRATLIVLREMLSAGMSIEDAIRWSNEPLPGDVDFAGKFKWQGERVVITIGKQAGSFIENVHRGFLQWMLVKDFPTETKAIVREYLLSGKLPQRMS